MPSHTVESFGKFWKEACRRRVDGHAWNLGNFCMALVNEANAALATRKEVISYYRVFWRAGDGGIYLSVTFDFPASSVLLHGLPVSYSVVPRECCWHPTAVGNSFAVIIMSVCSLDIIDGYFTRVDVMHLKS